MSECVCVCVGLTQSKLQCACVSMVMCLRLPGESDTSVLVPAEVRVSV